MCKIYGYCRISTKKQSLERQIQNIQKAYPDAVIKSEVYTGTKFQGREVLDSILKSVKEGDTLVFDSVSRMSRNADEGVKLYFELYNKGINLVFLKEAYINTDTYKKSLSNQLSMTGDDVDLILQGINSYLIKLAENQIRIAFDQAEKEVKDLQERTAEALRVKKESGVAIGGTLTKGTTKTTKKSIDAKAKIRKFSKSFGGNMDNKELMEFCKITEPTLLKYKKEIREEMLAEGKMFAV